MQSGDCVVTDISIPAGTDVTLDRRRRARPARLPVVPGYASGPKARTASGGGWTSHYVRLALAADIAAIVAATVLGFLLRFGVAGWLTTGVRIHYLFISVGILALWVGATAASGAYDGRFLGTGSEEFKRVVNASVRVAAVCS